jgi:large subunit ribosomal protein L6
MSKIGRKPINLPQGVEITRTSPEIVTVKGPKGTLTCKISKELELKNESGVLHVAIAGGQIGSIQTKCDFGTARASINSAIDGVSKGWQKNLQLEGVGYTATLTGKELTLNVGYSHPVKFTLPEGITCKVDKQINIQLDGIDAQVLGNFAAMIRKSAPAEPYQGKGIRYTGEQIRRKAGKAAAKAGK